MSQTSKEQLAAAKDETDIQAKITGLLADARKFAPSETAERPGKFTLKDEDPDDQSFSVTRNGVYLEASSRTRTDESARDPTRKVTTLCALAEVAGVRTQVMIAGGKVLLADYRDMAVPSRTITGHPNADALRLAAEAIELAAEELSA